VESEHEQFMSIAKNAASKSTCVRRHVGAIIVRNNEIVARGWNGVVGVFRNCMDAGCPRCTAASDANVGYEQCICIHAEQRAIAEAACRAISTKDALIYVSLRPCFQCLAIARAAGIGGIIFDEDWVYPEDFERPYRALAVQFAVFERIVGGGLNEAPRVL
jgi:dCMP deaminase